MDSRQILQAALAVDRANIILKIKICMGAELSMVNPLLITKFYPPAPRSDRVSVEQLSRVQRKRLLEKLDQGLTCKLILISAAAGFGKTTVLSEWAHQIKFSTSWLSLDERDSYLIRFWTYFVTALQQSHQNMGEAILAMLRSSELPSHEALGVAEYRYDLLSSPALVSALGGYDVFENLALYHPRSCRFVHGLRIRPYLRIACQDAVRWNTLYHDSK